MRLALTGAVLLAASLAAPGAFAQTSFEIDESFFGAVDRGGAIHYDGRAFERFDLTTGVSTVLYRRPRGTRFDIGDWDVGSGRIGAQLEHLGRTAALIVDTNTGDVTFVPGGRVEERRGCGTSVRFEDVSPSGEVLVTTARVRCGRRWGTLTLSAHGPSGIRTLHSRRVRHAWLSPEAPFRQLAGDQLLTVGDYRARVRDLATGAVRRIRTRARFSGLGYGAIAPDGRVLIDEFTRRPGTPVPRQVVRLLGPGDRGRGGAVVHDSGNGVFAGPLFCGHHPVALTQHLRGRYELRLLETGVVLAAGRHDPDDLDVACDAQHVVLFTHLEDEGMRLDVFALSG